MSYLGIEIQLLEQANALWTAKEICQQPACWRQTAELVAKQRQALDAFLAPLLRQADLHIILTGAGTSAFSGDVLLPFFNQFTSLKAQAIPTTDLVSNPYQYLKKHRPTLLVSFARSGNSPESASAVKLVNQIVDQGYHLIFSCNQEGKLYRENYATENVCALILPPQTNDKGFAMTSSFSSMTLAAVLVFFQPHFCCDVVEKLSYITQDFIEKKHQQIKALASNDVDRVVYLGSGGFKGLSQESALKLLELTAGEVVAIYDTPLGFRHGPKSIINAQTAVFVYLSNDFYTRQYDIDLCNELLRDGKVSNLVILTAQLDHRLPAERQICLEGLSDLSDLALVFPYITFAQMFAFYRSYLMGHTTDNPCPTGEVNRVVKGVIIHSYPLS